MKTKTIQALVILLAVGSLKAQSASDPSGSANTRHSKPSKGEITLQGCLGRATGDYILTQTDPGNTFKLEKANRKLKLGPHLGEQVLVTGWKSPTLSSSSDALNRAGPPSSDPYGDFHQHGRKGMYCKRSDCRRRSRPGYRS